MNAKKVLVVGGYGTVGSELSRILSGQENIEVFIGGRNEYKAREAAQNLNAGWRTIDLEKRESILGALKNIDLVINCFGGPFTGFNLDLPEAAVERGIHYLDVSGSYEYTERLLTLGPRAEESRTILVSGLGANPGIPGIVFAKYGSEFDEIDAGRIFFAMGAKIEGISVSGLKELRHMFAVEPLVWNGRWIVPQTKGCREYISEPFNKHLYFGASITRDLISLPDIVNVKALSFWSGSQSLLQGSVMLVGLKLGFAKHDASAGRFLNVLQFLGRGKKSSSDMALKLDIVGLMDGKKQRQVIEVSCDENYATAVAPAIACGQILSGCISQVGAFVPPEVVLADEFVQSLIHYNVPLRACSKIT